MAIGPARAGAGKHGVLPEDCLVPRRNGFSRADSR